MPKVCVLGHGFMGGVHAGIYHAMESTQLAAVVDLREEKREEARARYGCAVFERIDSVLEDDSIDIVDICLPTPLHAEFMIQCAEAGKHVLVEKPISYTLDQADAMISAAEEHGIKFMVAHVIRFWPEYIVTRELIASGELGAPLAANASRFVPAPDWAWDDWLLDPALSGGAVIDNHIHDIDFLNWILGEPQNVLARGLLSSTGAVDHIYSSLAYSEGRMAVAESGFFVPAGMGLVMTLRVNCEKGMIQLSNITDPTLTVYRPDEEPEHPALPEKDGYEAEIAYFVDCVVNDRQPDVVTPLEARRSLEVCWAAERSVRTGEIQAL